MVALLRRALAESTATPKSDALSSPLLAEGFLREPLFLCCLHPIGVVREDMWSVEPGHAAGAVAVGSLQSQFF